MTAAVAAIILGLVQLLFGRKLFWLMVAIAGFLIGWFLVPTIWEGVADWTRILIGIGLGLAFALLSLIFFRVFVAIAAFFYFATASVVLLRYLGVDAPDGSTIFWVIYAIGGVVGAALSFVFLDWMLIIFTSLAGASAVTGGIVRLADINATWAEIVLFAVLLAVGLMVQIWTFRAHPALIGRRRA